MEQEDKTTHALRWACGMVGIIGGLGLVKDGAFFSVILFCLSGILIFPPIADRINLPLKGKFGFVAQCITFFSLFFLGAIFIPITPKEEVLTAEQVQQIVVTALAEQAQAVADSESTSDTLTPTETTQTEEVSAEPEKSEAMKEVEGEISSKEAEISKIQGWIETFDCPFDEYQRINDMYFATGNMNANKDQFFIDVWQEEINGLESEVTKLNEELKTMN
jgi:uncharacterized membrane protein YhiD involved in acid resistance